MRVFTIKPCGWIVSAHMCVFWFGNAHSSLLAFQPRDCLWLPASAPFQPLQWRDKTRVSSTGRDKHLRPLVSLPPCGLPCPEGFYQSNNPNIMQCILHELSLVCWFPISAFRSGQQVSALTRGLLLSVKCNWRGSLANEVQHSRVPQTTEEMAPLPPPPELGWPFLAK